MANDVRIFVSGTCRDLEEDVRPAILKAIDFARVEPVSMESWEADYRSAVELCRVQLRDHSTHYVGVFGYYRGFVPDGETRSITEMEYDLAVECRPRASIAVFLPREASDIEGRLRARAEQLAQSAEDQAAQLVFLTRIRGPGVIEPFESEADLALRVNRKARSWAGGGLRGISAASPPATARPDRPREADLARLGLLTQARAFTDLLARLTAGAHAEVACVLIHGPAGAGHAHLARRLEQEFATFAGRNARTCVAGIGVLWRQDGPARLAATLGAQLGGDTAVTTIEDFALRLRTALEHEDVLLDVTQVQRYPNGVTGFATTFWQPLVAALGEPAHRLICTVSFEGSAQTDWTAVVRAHDADDEPAFLLALPALGAIAERDLAAWLRTWLPRADALAVAEALITETRGLPHLLFATLLDESTWNR